MSGSIFLAYAYFSSLAKLQNLSEIGRINAQQAQEILRLKAESEALQARLAEIEQLDKQVRSLIGFKERGPRPSLASRGGQPPAPREQGEQIKEIAHKLNEVAWNLPEKKKRLSGLIDYLETLPSFWPVRGPVTSPFGYRKSPFSREEVFHNGIDIAADYGTVVRAAGSGKVIFAGRDLVYGLMVVIEHGYEIESIYGHNSELLVHTGDEVKKGQPIARVGNSGLSTGPHLHFSIKMRGEFQDPLSYLNLTP
ncbi:MAG: hypothetical protein PWP65_1563 [Clostridia bacterium]|nr:hypothetical protein [Clostridia bacterium]